MSKKEKPYLKNGKAGELITEILKERQITKAEFHRQTGYASYSSTVGMLNGTKKMNMNFLKRSAEVLSIDISYLTGETPFQNISSLVPFIIDIVGAYNNAFISSLKTKNLELKRIIAINKQTNSIIFSSLSIYPHKDKYDVLCDISELYPEIKIEFIDLFYEVKNLHTGAISNILYDDISALFTDITDYFDFKLDKFVNTHNL